MHPILMHRIAATAVMPIVAASGFAGYSYTRTNHQPTPPSAQCITLNSDLYYNWSGNTAGDVARLQTFLNTRGYQAGTSGVFDQITLNSVEQFENDQGLTVTGYVDPALRTRIQTLSCSTGGNTNVPQGQLSITGVDAPQQLGVNQSGTWSVHLNATNGYQGGGQLHYSVVWGDEVQYAQAVSATNRYVSTTVQSSGSFTHVYTRAGTFTPVFTVTDDYGHSAQASATTRVSAAGGTGTTYCPAGQTYQNGYCYPAQTGTGSNTAYCQTPAGYYDRSCYSASTGITGYVTPPTGNAGYVDYYARTGATTGTQPYTYDPVGGNYNAPYSDYYARTTTGSPYASPYGSSYNTVNTGSYNQPYSDYYARTY